MRWQTSWRKIEHIPIFAGEKNPQLTTRRIRQHDPEVTIKKADIVIVSYNNDRLSRIIRPSSSTLPVSRSIRPSNPFTVSAPNGPRRNAHRTVNSAS